MHKIKGLTSKANAAASNAASKAKAGAVQQLSKAQDMKHYAQKLAHPAAHPAAKPAHHKHKGVAGKVSGKIGAVAHRAGAAVEDLIGMIKKLFPFVCMGACGGGGGLGVIMGFMVLIYSAANPSRDLNKSKLMLKMINWLWIIIIFLNLIIPLTLIIEKVIDKNIDAATTGGGGANSGLEKLLKEAALPIGLGINIVNIVIFTAMNLYANYKPTHVVDILLWKLSLLIFVLGLMAIIKGKEKKLIDFFERKQEAHPSSKLWHYLLKFVTAIKTIINSILDPMPILSMEFLIVILIFIFTFFSSSAHHNHIELYKMFAFLVYMFWCIVVNILIFTLPAPIPGVACQITWNEVNSLQK